MVTVSQGRRSRFREIDVERINIVEKDGQLRMVISNEKRQHPGIVNGKIIPRQGSRPPGMIFFNHLGDEMGGLIFGANGGNGHFGSLTFDKVRNDQAIGFRYLESDNGTYQSGLEMWQQPNIPADVMMAKYETVNKIADETKRKAALQELIDNGQLTTNRLFLGKRRDDALILSMADIKGTYPIEGGSGRKADARVSGQGRSGDIRPARSRQGLPAIRIVGRDRPVGRAGGYRRVAVGRPVNF